MDDTEIEQAIIEALLAYFRPGERLKITAAPQTDTFATTRALLLLHWAFSPPIVDLLRYLLMRHGEVISGSTQSIEETSEAIRGPVVWHRTILRRRITGNPTVTTFQDMHRTADLGPNRVLRFVVRRAMALLAPYASYEAVASSPYGEAIRVAFDLGIRASRIMEMRQIPRTLERDRPSAVDVNQARHSPRKLYRLAANAYRLYSDLVDRREDALTRVLTDTLVAPLSAWQRFELFTIVRLGTALARRTDIEPILEHLTGVMRIPAMHIGHLGLYWGVRPPGLYQPVPASQERQQTEAILSHFGVGWGEGRSDLILVDLVAQKVLAVVECKYTSASEMDPGRQFRDAVRQIVDYSGNYGLGQVDRISRSAVVMRHLPRQVEERGGISGTTDPVVLSAEDLLRGSSSLEEWLRRVVGTHPARACTM